MYTDSRPVYLRLRDIIVSRMLDGTLTDGDMLPSVRAFAQEQGANPLTVAKAYQSFQNDGLVVVRRGVGMFIDKGATARLCRMERKRFLTEIWPAIAAHMAALDIDLDELAGAHAE